MKPATLGQAVKVLSYLDGLSVEQVQKAIESGLLRESIINGDLESIRKKANEDKILEIWKTIIRLTKGDGIVITVARDSCRHAGNGGFQVRGWGPGRKYYPTRGHIDGGVDLFEFFLDKPLEDCGCCWEHTLSSQGIRVNQHDWHKETKIATDGSSYDEIMKKVK
jgi:hypothetical protein